MSDLRAAIANPACPVARPLPDFFVKSSQKSGHAVAPSTPRFGFKEDDPRAGISFLQVKPSTEPITDDQARGIAASFLIKLGVKEQDVEKLQKQDHFDILIHLIQDRELMQRSLKSGVMGVIEQFLGNSYISKRTYSALQFIAT